MRLRAATPHDIPAMLALRGQLALDPARGGEATTTRGGFLLGTDAAGYALRIAAATVVVLEEGPGALRGFAIVLPNDVFRASEIWSRRDAVQWSVDIGRIEAAPMCYFDQLAVRPGGPWSRRWGAALALRAVLDALPGHDLLVSSTVIEPVRNLAAVPYLRRVGAQAIGSLDEVYPEVGPLRSEVWLAEREAICGRVAAPRGAAEAWVVAEAGRR